MCYPTFCYRSGDFWLRMATLCHLLMLYLIPQLSICEVTSEADSNNAISHSSDITEGDDQRNCNLDKLNSLCSHSSLIQERQGSSQQILRESKFSRHLKSLSLSDRANLTYSKILPCLNKAWIMNKWEINGNWSFPSDAEEHYRDLNAKAAAFRVAPIHHYAGYDGTITLNQNHWNFSNRIKYFCSCLRKFYTRVWAICYQILLNCRTFYFYFFFYICPGPWLENLFIYNYMHKPLSFFNGLIPIFIQWIDTDIQSKSDAVRINQFLKKELRSNVLYLAISQVIWFPLDYCCTRVFIDIFRWCFDCSNIN